MHTALHAVRRPAAAGLAGLLLLGVVACGVLGPAVQVWVVDLVELGCATAAALLGARRWRASTGRLRRSWAWLAGGCASWALGQAVWSAYELLLHVDAPFPSAADAGFLGFPLAAAVGLSLLPPRRHPGELYRRLLDGVTVVVALTLVSWTTALGAVLRAGGTSVELAVSLAYPATDVVLLTLAVVALAHSGGQRVPLVLVGTGMAAMAVSDSAFAYGSATGGFSTGLVDLGWCSAFLLLALAAHLPEEPPAASAPLARTASPLPYVTLLVAGAVVLARTAGGRPFDAPMVWSSALLVVLVVLRQWSAVRDNQALLRIVAERERQMQHQALHDDLTGLPNRALFSQGLVRALATGGGPLAVGFLDLDGFKAVNDALGHQAGDELLAEVAQRLRACLRSDDLVARLGGDEFGLLLDGCDAAAAERIGAVVLEALRVPVALRGRLVRVSGSMGVAVHLPGAAGSGGSADALLAAADVAMYDVKRRGRNGLRLHTPGLQVEEAEDLALREALRQAIEAREVRAVFQPIVALGTRRVEAVETLARWRHQGVDVPPPVFVGVADRGGLGAALTDLMIDQALEQLARWRARPEGSDVVVGVNISPAELLDPDLPGRTSDALERHGVPGGQLLMEVTESGLMVDLPRALIIMAALRELGVSFSLDDFGTGYSSLSQLVALPLASVQIDREFVRDLEHDPERLRLLEGVLALTRHIGLRVVAEGIETPRQLTELRRIGCTWGQGYLLGRPVPAGELTALPAPEAVPAA